MVTGVSVRWLVLLAAAVSCCKGFLFGCPPCELVECPELSCEASMQILDPECGCCAVCAKADAEACGGSTNQQCVPESSCIYRPGLIMGVERTGICEPAVCKRTQCPYRRYCGAHMLNGQLLFECICRVHNCEGKFNPVCGYDGATYISVCHLHYAECLTRDFIGLRHMGPCVPTSAPPTEDYVKTNTIPVYVDDLFDQVVDPLPETEMPVDPGCTYKGFEYARNTRTKLDSCTYLYCEADGSAVLVIVPGCPGGPVEVDYAVSLPPVHGGWSEWMETECIGTCHGAHMTLKRYCTNPAPRNEGRNCSGSSEMVIKCIPDYCNYTCDYDEWSEWDPCSVTCGLGTHQRRRGLLNNITELEANNCDLVETKSCYMAETCPTSCQRVRLGYKKFFDVNGCETFKEWPDYVCAGPCSGEEDCCQVSRWRDRRVPVQCPGNEYLQDSRIEFIQDCSCDSQKSPTEC